MLECVAKKCDTPFREHREPADRGSAKKRTKNTEELGSKYKHTEGERNAFTFTKSKDRSPQAMVEKAASLGNKLHGCFEKIDEVVHIAGEIRRGERTAAGPPRTRKNNQASLLSGGIISKE